MSRRAWALGLVLVLAPACSTTRPSPWIPDSQPRSASAAEQLVAEADALVERGQPQIALPVYERVLRDYPEDPAAATALYSLGRLQADPTSRLRNYRAAHAAFSRLITTYPTSGWEPEARAWRAVLSDLLAREEEAVRLRSQIERLRRTDLDLERRH